MESLCTAASTAELPALFSPLKSQLNILTYLKLRSCLVTSPKYVTLMSVTFAFLHLTYQAGFLTSLLIPKSFSTVPSH